MTQWFQRIQSWLVMAAGGAAAFFAEFGLWQALALVVASMGAVNGLVRLMASGTRGPERIRWLLTRRTPMVGYRRLVNTTLDRIDRWLIPSDYVWRPETTEEARNPFGWPLLAFSLRLAFVYPTLLMIFFWLLGGEGRFGVEFVVLPGAVDAWVRPAAIGVIAIFTVSLVIEKILSSPAGLVLQLVSLGLAYTLAYAVSVGAAYAVAFVIVVVIAYTAAYAVSIAAAYAAAMPAAYAYAYAVSAPYAVAVEVVAAYATTVAAVAVAAVAVAVERTVTRAMVRGHGRAAHTLLIAGTLPVGFWAAWIAPPTEDNAFAAFLLFLLVLPLTNAVFDYVSFGVTRALMQRGAQKNMLVAFALGLADLAFALVMFTVLGTTLIAIVSAMNMVTAVPVVDFNAVFFDLGRPERRLDYYWLWAMLFSTLVPTLLHASLACFALTAFIPRVTRRSMLSLLTMENRDGFDDRVLRIGLTVQIWVSAVLPFLLLGGLVWAVLSLAPGVGVWYLGLFEALALG
ncbi:MAG: hypothetical protein AAGI34_08415 [Pseudomonadota bacterium]